MKDHSLAYVDTSLWMRLVDREDPRRRRLTHRFMKTVRRKLRLRVSKLVMAEIRETDHQGIRRQAVRRLYRQRPRVVPRVPAVRRIVENLERAGVLTQNHLADLYHIGYALFSGARYLVTWNMRDLAWERTRRYVTEWCRAQGCPVMRLGTPEQVQEWLRNETKS